MKKFGFGVWSLGLDCRIIGFAQSKGEKEVWEASAFCSRCFSSAAFVARKGAKARKDAKDMVYLQ
jgi:hypothetical protein